ncbi:conserved hypothetical protein [Lebetimonas natsushimae]|uniref:Uncharacterized protein n=1 Tax=Lebetimonas natsushimae TaxID=1936991 RepID=A0A292YGB8_9BACT|nr:hypothetical protein [Lebetimonas natsushimae]GAX88146.1 conserved hypothetical protein [Lebetimonas natsushimae]
MNEKEILLDEVSKVIEEDSLSVSFVKNVVFAIIFSLAILFPKIYIANNIYTYSLKINKLLNEYYSLKAEQFILTSKIEKIKFKNRLQRLTF